MSNQVEKIIFNGVIFRRYPNSKNKAQSYYFRPGMREVKKGIKSLHQEIWISHNGKIPKGYFIHHKDGNPTNNKISNLELIDSKEHSSHHRKLEWSDKKIRPEKLKQLKKARVKAFSWHKTEDGKKYHKWLGKRSKAYYKNKEPRKLICSYCKEEFLTKSTKPVVLYCNSSCSHRSLRVLRGLPVKVPRGRSKKT